MSTVIKFSCKKFPPFSLVTTYILFLLVGGCSVVDYKTPVEDLNDAFNTSIMTVEMIDKEVTKMQNDQLRQQIENGEAVLLAAKNSCAGGYTSCSLVVRKDKKNRYFPVKTVIPGFPELKNYVSNLNAIVDAETVEAVVTSVNEALVSAAKIEDAMVKANNPEAKSTETIKGYSEPVLASVRWLIDRYVNRMKIKSLAVATSRAQPVIEKLSTYHQSAATALTTLKVTKVQNAFISDQRNYDDAEVKSNRKINAYLTSVNSYDVALKSRSAHPLKQFLDAHTKLTENLNGTADTSLADVIASIKEFKKQANEAKKIIDVLMELDSDQEGE